MNEDYCGGDGDGWDGNLVGFVGLRKDFEVLF